MSPRSDRGTARLLVLFATIAVPTTASAQNGLPASAVDAFRIILSSPPLLVSPRVYSAYGALIAAAMLSVLYLYRGRGFIVYWIAGWVLVAAALTLVSRAYDDVRLAAIMLGLALLFVVWSTGLMVLAAESFPERPLRWNTPVRVAAASALWFLLAPFAVQPSTMIATATVLSSILLGWSAMRYLQLARVERYAGAFLIGIGFALICLANLTASTVLVGVAGRQTLDTVAAINVVTSMFVALGMHLLVFEDMTTELRRTNRDLGAANEEVKRLAITDPLTGCHNRRFFDEIERREMQRHRRYGSPLSVVFVDVNHFKGLNDTLGHDKGDETLRTIGAVLRRQVRESDYVIRWGGDEFLLLLACGEEEAQAKARELKLAFDRERTAAALPDQVGLSVGVAAVPRDAGNLRDAIRDADDRMYRDKSATRARR
jgi:diguanylate cyclase (GGDEF)-like protein